MTRRIALLIALSLAPLAASAMPKVGDQIGTNATDATAALAKAGCTVTAFEAEDGKIEAKCTDTATGKLAEVYIDPKTGAVADIKDGD